MRTHTHKRHTGISPLVIGMLLLAAGGVFLLGQNRLLSFATRTIAVVKSGNVHAWHQGIPHDPSPCHVYGDCDMRNDDDDNTTTVKSPTPTRPPACGTACMPGGLCGAFAGPCVGGTCPVNSDWDFIHTGTTNILRVSWKNSNIMWGYSNSAGAWVPAGSGGTGGSNLATIAPFNAAGNVCAGGQCIYDEVDTSMENGQQVVRFRRGYSFMRYIWNGSVWTLASTNTFASLPGVTVANGPCPGGACTFDEFDFTERGNKALNLHIRRGSVIWAFNRPVGATTFTLAATTNLATTAPFNAAGGVCAGGVCNIQNFDFNQNGTADNFLRFRSGNTIWAYKYPVTPNPVWTLTNTGNLAAAPWNAAGSGLVCDTANNLCKIPACVGQTCTCNYQPPTITITPTRIPTITLTPTPPKCGQTCTTTGGQQCETGMVCDTSTNICKIPDCVGQTCTCAVPSITPTPPACGQTCSTQTGNECETGMTCDTATNICKIPECVGQTCTCSYGSPTPTPPTTALGDEEKMRVTVTSRKVSNKPQVRLSWGALENAGRVSQILIRRYEKTTNVKPKQGESPVRSYTTRATATSYTDSSPSTSKYNFYQVCVTVSGKRICTGPTTGFKGGVSRTLSISLTIPAEQ